MIGAPTTAAIRMAKVHSVEWAHIVRPYNELLLKLGEERKIARRLDQATDDKPQEGR